MSFGKGSEKTSSQPSSVWKPQRPFLQDLYAQAQRMAADQGVGIGQASQELSQGLMGGAGGYLNAGTNPAIQQLMQYGQQGNPFLSQQIAGLGADLGQFYRQQLLPGIASSAGLAGQFGGSRQGIAAGMAGQDVARQFAQGATQLRSNAYGQGINATLGAGGLAAENVAQLGNLYNLGMSPYSAQWMPLSQYANIVGGPAILGGGSSGKGFNFNIGL